MSPRRRVALTLATTAVLAFAALPIGIGAAGAAAGPTVTGVSAPYGSVKGGATVTVTGTGFSRVTSLRFDTTKGAKVTVLSSRKLTVTAPKHDSGRVDVRVRTRSGTSPKVKADRFLYAGAPVITGVNSTHGPTDGSGDLRLTGSAFFGVKSVQLDGRKIGFVTFHPLSGSPATEVAPQLPPHREGRVSLTVTAVGGTSKAISYYYADQPEISLSPAAGPAAGGKNVYITGTGLVGVKSVSVGGVSEPFGYELGTPNRLFVTAPAHAAGRVDVVVTAVAGQGRATYTYVG